MIVKMDESFAILSLRMLAFEKSCIRRFSFIRDHLNQKDDDKDVRNDLDDS